MKKVLILFWTLLLFWACVSKKAAVKTEKTGQNSTIDSVEYGIETFDAKFETWYTLHNSPALYRSKAYYENWNKQYVQAWNNKAANAEKNGFFSTVVGYNPRDDYGFDVNHKLFYYFQYVENVLKIEILPRGPKVVPY